MNLLNCENVALTEVLEWYTDINTSYNGKEKTFKLRDLPRRTLSLKAFTSNIGNFHQRLRDGHKSEWYIPLWPLAVSGQITGTSCTLPALYRELSVGLDCLIYSSEKECSIVNIVSMTQTSFTFLTYSGQQWSITNGLHTVIPLTRGYLTEMPTRELNGRDEFINATFTVVAYEYTESEPAETLDGHDLDLGYVGLLEGDRCTANYQYSIERADQTVGAVGYLFPWEKMQELHPFRVMLTTVEDQYSFKQWLFRRAGRYRYFWFPTWENDINIISASGNSIYTDQAALANIVLDDSNKYVAAVKDNIWQAHEIISISAVTNGLVQITFSGDVSSAEYISWLTLRRLNTDRVEISYSTGGIATIALTTATIQPGSVSYDNPLILTEAAQVPVLAEDATPLVQEITDDVVGAQKMSAFPVETAAALEQAYVPALTVNTANYRFTLASLRTWLRGIFEPLWSAYTDTHLTQHTNESDPHRQYILGSEIGVTVPPLVDGLIPSTFLPGTVSPLQPFDTLSSFPVIGLADVIYVANDTRLTYRWSGSAYVEISPSVALGETALTAYRGDRGKVAYDHSQTAGNPHGTNASDVGAAAISHAHGAVTTDGKIGSAAGLPVTTGTGGALQAAAWSTTAPVMNGTASVGTSVVPSRSDHVHPTDTSRAAATATLANNTARSTLPTAGTATALATLLQQTRDYLAGLTAKFTDGSVTKVGTATVGSTTQPIYLNAGVATAITGTIDNSTTGNAATATKLATARTIALTGDVTGSASFDGSANVSITTTKNYEFDVTGGNTGSYTNWYSKIASWVPSAGVTYFIKFEFDYFGINIYPWDNKPFTCVVTYRDGIWSIYYNKIGSHAAYSRIYAGVTGSTAEIYGCSYGSNIRMVGRMVEQSTPMYSQPTSMTSTQPSYINDLGFAYNIADDSDKIDGKHVVVTAIASKGTDANTLYFCY